MEPTSVLPSTQSFASCDKVIFVLYRTVNSLGVSDLPFLPTCSRFHADTGSLSLSLGAAREFDVAKS